MGEEVICLESEEEDDLSCLFKLDKNPSHVADSFNIPAYSSKFKTLKEKDEVEAEPTKPTRPSAVTCWNCGGDHSLRDCTKPRNHAMIARKRAETLAKSTKYVRYHADEEQKHPHLRPGSISDRLREAMGLRPDQAPPFIYRMRELGYPPGWVEEARVSHSGLSMFGSSGQEVKDPDLEDGEIVSKVDRDKYDFRKLIEYPGFNVPFEPEITDETELLNAPPLRESQSIKHMLELWSGKQTESYRRKRMKTQHSQSPSVSTSNIVQGEDMELDAEEEEVKCLPPTSPSLPETSESSPPVSKCTKRKLSSKKKKKKVSPPGVDDGDLRKGELATKETDSTEDQKVDLVSPTETYNGRVKSVSSGTPVITRSEFKQLPCPENFSKNICDVINFENLPNATGKYEQMYGLIKKVRTFVTESQMKADEE